MLRKYKQALLWFRLSDKDYTTARDNNVSPVGTEPNLYSKTYRARRKISWILTIQRSIVSHDLQFARFFSLTLIISYQIHIFHSILSSSDDKYVFHRYFRQEQYSPESINWIQKGIFWLFTSYLSKSRRFNLCEERKNWSR